MLVPVVGLYTHFLELDSGDLEHLSPSDHSDHLWETHLAHGVLLGPLPWTCDFSVLILFSFAAECNMCTINLLFCCLSWKKKLLAITEIKVPDCRMPLKGYQEILKTTGFPVLIILVSVFVSRAAITNYHKFGSLKQQSLPLSSRDLPLWVYVSCLLSYQDTCYWI